MSLLAWALSITNQPMRLRVALNADSMKARTNELLTLPDARMSFGRRPARSFEVGPFIVTGVDPFDCGGPSAGVGAEAWFTGGEDDDVWKDGPRAGLRPRLLYCPKGVELGLVGDKYADVEHLAGDWWIDWQDM